MKGRGKNLILAFVIAALIIVCIVVAFNLVPENIGTPRRILQILGGFMPGGVIQLITFFFFFWGLFEIFDRNNKIKYERQSFGMNLLPEKEHWVLSPEDVTALKLKVIDIEKNSPFLMTDIIKKASTKFRSDNSVSDVMQVVSNQIKINTQKAEGGQSIIRYAAWAIPSIGFIGTILGIAQALGMADRANDPAVLSQITANMYVAFDTTLLSLILSVILMWFFHNLQETEEDLHTDMEEYIYENFVNRIHVE